MTDIATAATTYAAPPVQNAAAIPKNTEMTTPKTDAQTDAAPLTPQRNAARGGPHSDDERHAHPEAQRREQADRDRDAHRGGLAVVGPEDLRREQSEEDHEPEQDQQRSQVRRRSGCLDESLGGHAPDPAEQQDREQHD